MRPRGCKDCLQTAGGQCGRARARMRSGAGHGAVSADLCSFVRPLPRFRQQHHRSRDRPGRQDLVACSGQGAWCRGRPWRRLIRARHRSSRRASEGEESSYCGWAGYEGRRRKIRASPEKGRCAGEILHPANCGSGLASWEVALSRGSGEESVPSMMVGGGSCVEQWLWRLFPRGEAQPERRRDRG